MSSKPTGKCHQDINMIDRIDKKMVDNIPRAIEQIYESINEIQEQGYTPKKIILCTLKPFLDAQSRVSFYSEKPKYFFGLKVEERVLRKPNGELIEIAFECEK